MERRYSVEEEKFFRGMMLPQEDLPPGIYAKRVVAFRWFRAPNIFCIEHYRQAPAAPAPLAKPAA